MPTRNKLPLFFLSKVAPRHLLTVVKSVLENSAELDTFSSVTSLPGGQWKPNRPT